jgi:hypothetical protein
VNQPIAWLVSLAYSRNVKELNKLLIQGARLGAGQQPVLLTDGGVAPFLPPTPTRARTHKQEKEKGKKEKRNVTTRNKRKIEKDKSKKSELLNRHAVLPLLRFSPP